MGTTANLALPYPANTDALANMAAAVQSLATAIDTKLYTGSTGWTAISGASAPGAPFQAPQYRKVGDQVQLRGICQAGGGGIAIGATIGTLPTGFRPISTQRLIAINNTGAANAIDVSAAGVITPVFVAVPAGGYIVLGSMSFSVS